MTLNEGLKRAICAKVEEATRGGEVHADQEVAAVTTGNQNHVTIGDTRAQLADVPHAGTEPT